MPRVNSHAALMRWHKSDLVDLASDHARRLGLLRTLRYSPGGLAGLDKRTLAHLVMGLAKRLSAREAAQGE